MWTLLTTVKFDDPGLLCCSVLQYVAVCCSVLKCVAVCCSVLQCVALCCSVLQCVAVCSSVTLGRHTFCKRAGADVEEGHV